MGDLGPDGLPKRPMFHKEEEPAWKEFLLFMLIIAALVLLTIITVWGEHNVKL